MFLPKIIVKSGYMKSGTTRSAYVKYIATRDGVENNYQSNGHLQATKKQDALIKQLLDDYPDSVSLFEYDDYLEEPTRARASAFISTVMEFNLETIIQKENYVGYIANRPRVERLGEHGLFSSTNDVINLEEVAKEVKEHEGNVWTHIISLTRGDATRLGYDNAEAWKQLCRSKVNEIEKAMKMNPNELKWYASFHNENHHPHIHMIVYSTNPKKGYLNQNGISKIRSAFASEIFKQDRIQIYQEQTKIRDEIKTYSRDVITKTLQNMKKSMIDNEAIFHKIIELKETLKNYHGRLLYGYIPKNAKQIVNDIVREIEKDTNVQTLYEQWRLYKQEIQQNYNGNPIEKIPLLEQKEFKSIKNMILKEVTETDIDTVTFHEVKPIVIEDISFRTEIDEINTEDIWEDVNIEEDEEYIVEWSDTYKEAVQYFYGSDDIEKNLETAKELLEKESASSNVIAFELLAKLYALEENAEYAELSYTKALDGSLSILEIDDSEFIQNYLNYKVGKFYFYGLGTDQDYMRAKDYFEKSSNQYANYSLGTMYERGLGVEVSKEKALSYFELAAKEGNAYASYKVGQYLEKGTGCEANRELSNIHYETAYKGLATLLRKQEDDNILYCLGMMSYYGKGVPQDIIQAKQYLKKATDFDNDHAKLLLAKIYLEDKDGENIPIAINWLEELETVESKYLLGKEYASGKNIAKDIDKAIDLFNQCEDHSFAKYQLGKLYLENGGLDSALGKQYLLESARMDNDIAKVTLAKIYLEENDYENISIALRWLEESDLENAKYILGKEYLSGEIVEKNISKAIQYFESCGKHSFALYQLGKIYLDSLSLGTKKGLQYLEESANLDNESAQIQLGKIYLEGIVVGKDVDKAISYLIQPEENNNQFAQYMLGKLFLFGKDVPQDKEKAIEYLTKSAEQGNEYASFLLEHMDDYHTQSLAMITSRFFHHISKIFEDNLPTRTGVHLGGIDRKLAQKIKRKKVAQGHKEYDHEVKMK